MRILLLASLALASATARPAAAQGGLLTRVRAMAAERAAGAAAGKAADAVLKRGADTTAAVAATGAAPDVDGPLRIPLHGLVFLPGDTLDANGVVYVRQFAHGLADFGAGGWTVQARVAPSDMPARDRARADRRAAAVRDAMLAAGVPAARLTVAGVVAPPETTPGLGDVAVFLVHRP